MSSEKDDDIMAHDPLDDLGQLSSTADDILEGELMPAERKANDQEPMASVEKVDEQAVAAMADLGDSLTIREVGACYEQLLAALDNNNEQNIVLDSSGLEQIDGAGLQMLAAFVQEVDKRGMTFNWSETPACLREGAQRIGMGAALRLT